MNAKKILIALAALSFLAAYFFGIEVFKKRADEKAKRESSLILEGMKKDEINSFTALLASGDIVEAKKQDGEWVLEKPVKSRADDAVIMSMLERHAAAVPARVLEEVVPAEYGLDTPQGYIEFSGSGGKTIRFNMAGYNPADGFAYLSKEGDDTRVFLVEKHLRLDLDKAVHDFRYKGALVVDEEGLKKIRVSLTGNRYTLEKKGDSGWEITEPFKKPAKMQAVTAIINSVKNSGAKGFEEASPELLQKRGLARPAEYIELDDGRGVKRVYFGKKDAEKHSIYAMDGAGREIMELPDYVYSGVMKLADAENRQPIIFGQDEVSKFSAEYGDKKIVMARKKAKDTPGDRWEYEEFKGLDAGVKKLISGSSVVSAVFWMEKKEEVAGGEKPGHGLTPGRAVIKLWGDNGKLLGTVVAGNKTEDEEGLIYAKVPEQNIVFKAEERFITNLNLPELALE
ncbi:MAG TPA: DUF4340 domain-containing protein [bacterium]|nr:DUF4340 domain-containing protein [bacterium]